MGIELPQDFKEFLNLLRVNRVENLLIGAYAVGYHGYPRATKDLGIWIDATSDNAARLLSTLNQFGLGTPELTTEIILKPNNLIRMGEEPLRIEILNWASGLSFKECYSARIVDNLDGVEVNLIGCEDLKTNKRASGR